MNKDNFENIAINGTNYVLRNFNIGDFLGIRSWVNNKIVTCDLIDSLIFEHYHNEDETMSFLNNSLMIDSQNIKLVIDYKDIIEYLGQVSLFNFIANTCEIDIVIAEPNNWDKGIGTESIKLLSEFAHNSLKINTIYAKIKKTNERAKKCAFNSNFKIADISNPIYILYKHESKIY